MAFSDDQIKNRSERENDSKPAHSKSDLILIGLSNAYAKAIANMTISPTG